MNTDYSPKIRVVLLLGLGMMMKRVHQLHDEHLAVEQACTDGVHDQEARLTRDKLRHAL